MSGDNLVPPPRHPNVGVVQRSVSLFNNSSKAFNENNENKVVGISIPVEKTSNVNKQRNSIERRHSLFDLASKSADSARPRPSAIPKELMNSFNQVSNSSFTPLASKSADSDIANKFVRPRPATIPRDGSLSFNDVSFLTPEEQHQKFILQVVKRYCTDYCSNNDHNIPVLTMCWDKTKALRKEHTRSLFEVVTAINQYLVEHKQETSDCLYLAAEKNYLKTQSKLILVAAPSTYKESAKMIDVPLLTIQQNGCLKYSRLATIPGTLYNYGSVDFQQIQGVENGASKCA